MNTSLLPALVLAACSGFIALGYEIVWARLYNFISGSRGEAFSAMLGSYLVGIAGGSLISRCWQRNPDAASRSRWIVPARLMLFASTLSFLVLPLAARMVSNFPGFEAHPLRTLPGVALAAFGLGTILPLLCHFTVAADKRTGFHVSLIYFANILGSGAGSLVTGFVLLDKWGSATTNMMLLIAGLIVAAALIWVSRASTIIDRVAFGLSLCAVIFSPFLHHDLFPRLFFGTNYGPGARLDQVVETRHGVIMVDTNRLVYGNKLYDGTLQTKLRPGTGLIRPYFISAVHPRPTEVLVVGVSGGAWTQILAHNPHVEKVTAVEINAGYLEVIRQHAEVASLLSNLKVEIIIDDGRRWLQRHPERRFDVIAMNTTFHWREFASALLSQEYLTLVREHLKPGGLVMWNCTGSARAIRTGMAVFPHTLMVMNNCVGSMEPLVIDRARWRDVLERYEIDGERLFEPPAGPDLLNEILTFGETRKYVRAHWFMRERKQMEERYGKAVIITDDNLGEEYRSILPKSFEELIAR